MNDAAPPPATLPDWLVCNTCGQVTDSPYRVSPFSGRPLPAEDGGYCPGCYEDACRRAQRDREVYTILDGRRVRLR